MKNSSKALGPNRPLRLWTLQFPKGSDVSLNKKKLTLLENKELELLL